MSSSPSLADMRPSQNYSFERDVTSIFRQRMAPHRSTPQPFAGVTPSPNIEARCNVDLQHKYGRTSLYVVTQENHASVAVQLIEARCNIDLQDQGGLSPLHSAAGRMWTSQSSSF